MSNRKAVVLLSGGLDSATVLAIARVQDTMTCATLAIDYGQRHRHELTAALALSRSLGAVSHKVIGLDLRAIGGSALTSDAAVPKDRSRAQMDAGGIPITYVPARNLVMLSLAAGYAEVIGAQTIYTGVNSVDYSGYPDCRPAFIESVVRTINLATKAGAESLANGKGPYFDIRTPLITMTKAQIISAGLKLNVDYRMTHSCYDPIVRTDGVVGACGSCDSCHVRKAGFEAAGVPDQTVYG